MIPPVNLMFVLPKKLPLDCFKDGSALRTNWLEPSLIARHDLVLKVLPTWTTEQ